MGLNMTALFRILTRVPSAMFTKPRLQDEKRAERVQKTRRYRGLPTADPYRKVRIPYAEVLRRILELFQHISD